MTTFNGWIMGKVLGYLKTSEGVSMETVNYTYEGVDAVVQDVFGNRYQVTIKTLGRIQLPDDEPEAGDLCNFR